jgi:hypothetical protein
VQDPAEAQNASQQSTHGSPNAQELGQAEPVPVQVIPQLPAVLQLLPQQANPATHVESSLHGQPKPAQPSASTAGGVARNRPARTPPPKPMSARSAARRDRFLANDRVQRSN